MWKKIASPKNYATLKSIVKTKGFLLLAAYAVFPVDLIPDIIPIIGQADDLLVTLLSIAYLIIPKLSQQSQAAIARQISNPVMQQAVQSAVSVANVVPPVVTTTQPVVDEVAYTQTAGARVQKCPMCGSPTLIVSTGSFCSRCDWRSN